MKLKVCVLLTAALLVGTAFADERQEGFRRVVLSAVDDEQLAGVVRDTRTTFYTKDDVPTAFQITGRTQAGNVHAGGAAQYGFFAATFNPAVDGDWQFQTGNFSKDFPWESPAGMHIVPHDSFRTFRFVRLPLDQNDRTLPVAWFHGNTVDRDNVDDAPPLIYTYPSGTVFGEVLMQKIGDNNYDPFEVRTRTKRSSQDWDVAVYRRWSSSDDLADSVESLLPREDWSNEPGIRKVLKHLRQKKALPVINISDRSIHPDRQAITATGGLDVLPAFDDDHFVRTLLASNKLQDVTGGTWEAGTNGAVSYAPAVATSGSLHIVPQNYAAFPYELSNESCMRCHATAGQGVKHFDKSLGRWYGHVGGSDCILSFHPFDAKTLNASVVQTVLRSTKLPNVPVEPLVGNNLNHKAYEETDGAKIVARYQDSLFITRTSVCSILDGERRQIGSGVMVAQTDDGQGHRLGAVISPASLFVDRGPYYAVFPKGDGILHKLSEISRSMELNIALSRVDDVIGSSPVPLAASTQDSQLWLGSVGHASVKWDKTDTTARSDGEFSIKGDEHPQLGSAVITDRGVVVGISIGDQKCRHGSAIWEWMANNEDVPRWIRGDVKSSEIERFSGILRRDIR
jgi:hypothetical protein